MLISESRSHRHITTRDASARVSTKPHTTTFIHSGRKTGVVKIPAEARHQTWKIPSDHVDKNQIICDYYWKISYHKIFLWTIAVQRRYYWPECPRYEYFPCGLQFLICDFTNESVSGIIGLSHIPWSGLVDHAQARMSTEWSTAQHFRFDRRWV